MRLYDRSLWADKLELVRQLTIVKKKKNFAPQLARILFPIVYIAWTVAVFATILWINNDNHKLVDPKECSFGGVPITPLAWH